MLGFPSVASSSTTTMAESHADARLGALVEDAVRRAAPPLPYFMALRRVSFPLLFRCASTSLALLAVGQTELQTLQTRADAGAARLGYVYAQLGRLNQTTWGLAAQVNYLGGGLDALVQAENAGAQQLGGVQQAFVLLVRALQNETAALERLVH